MNPILCDDKKSCCGCSACFSLCKSNAIKMKVDQEGFLYPTVDENECVHCNQCVEVCAFKRDQKKFSNCITESECLVPVVYAVKHKDVDTRMNSRSGGIFTALSDVVLEAEGVVYGCSITSDFMAVHMRAENKEQRDLMRGSKYIQSDLKMTFSLAKQDLNMKRKVLFSGTSCQIAGLRSYLGKEYDNLFCIDIVCHGVPSPMVWKDYIVWQEKKAKGKCIAVDFRNKKDFGWATHVETLTFDNGKRTNSKVFKSLFYGHTILRPTCYECPYKSVYHPGDISIADYWGIDKAAPGFNDNKGVSLVLVNSEKGALWFESVLSQIEYRKCHIKDSMQQSFIKPYAQPTNRDEFWNDYYTRSFDLIARKYGNYGLVNSIREMLRLIRRKLF